MPRNDWSVKRERQYEHVKESLLEVSEQPWHLDITERFAASGHRMEDGQQLACADRESELLGFASGQHALVDTSC